MTPDIVSGALYLVCGVLSLGSGIMFIVFGLKILMP